MPRQYLYRLWFPKVGYHGSSFDKLCGKCQGKIEEELNDGFVLPTTVGIDTSIGISLKFGFKVGTVELCKGCQEKIKEFLASADFVSFGSNKPIELWRNKKEP